MISLDVRVRACLADCATSIEWAAPLIDAPDRCAFRESASDARALLRELDATPTDPRADFLAYCEARAKGSEFWRRLAGSVRKSLTM